MGNKNTKSVKPPKTKKIIIFRVATLQEVESIEVKFIMKAVGVNIKDVVDSLQIECKKFGLPPIVCLESGFYYCGAYKDVRFFGNKKNVYYYNPLFFKQLDDLSIVGFFWWNPTLMNPTELMI